MKTSGLIADRLKNADVVINIDGGGGVLDEGDAASRCSGAWSGAEKTYADFEMTVTDPGGHSSAPRAVNAIVRMSKRAGADRRLSLQARAERPDAAVVQRGRQIRERPEDRRRR